jgi:hypothetical protein
MPRPVLSACGKRSEHVMIIILGLIVLIAAVIAAVVGVHSNSGYLVTGSR